MPPTNPILTVRLPEMLVPAGAGQRVAITTATAQSMTAFPTTSVTHVLLAGDPVGVFRYAFGGEAPTTTSGAICSGGVFVRELVSVDTFNAMKIIQVASTGSFYAMPFMAS